MLNKAKLAEPQSMTPSQQKPVIKPLLLTRSEMQNDFSIISGRTVIVYGNSGAGKSTLLAEFASAANAKEGSLTRLITAEDSSKSIFAPLIRDGIVEALVISKVSQPVSLLRRLSRGEWPDQNGEWRLWDYGAHYYIIEGLSSIAELIQEDCRENGRFMGEQAASSVVENGERLMMASQFTYSFSQMEVIRAICTFAMIPRIKRVFWSAHEVQANDDFGADIRGPALVGTAKTGAVQKYAGMVLHLSSNPPHKLYFKSHPDPKRPLLTYPAKVTLPLYAIGQFEKLVGASDHMDLTIKDGVLPKGLYSLIEAETQAISLDKPTQL